MPTPPTPTYEEWASVWKTAQSNETTIIVAHSSGCGFILKWLSLNPAQKIGDLFLVAPWLDLKKEDGEFLQCQLDPKLMQRVKSLHILFSENEDVDGVSQSKDLLLEKYPSAILHTFKSYGHFTLRGLGKAEFPELWEMIERA